MREKSYSEDQDLRIQNRILALEMELRQMGREGLLTDSQYQKKSLFLKKLQMQFNDLKNLRGQGISKSQQKDSSWFEIPLFSHRLPRESVISMQYLTEFTNLLRYMLRESDQVGRLVRASVRGRLFDFMSTLDLARIKRSLVRLDSRIKNFSLRKKQWTAYIERVYRHLHSGKPDKRNPESFRSLRKKYFEADRLGQEVQRMKIRCEHWQDELDLMENWLSFQEWRLTQTWVPEGKRLSVPPQTEKDDTSLT